MAFHVAFGLGKKERHLTPGNGCRLLREAEARRVERVATGSQPLFAPAQGDTPVVGTVLMAKLRRCRRADPCALPRVQSSDGRWQARM